jgi:hypothetical protein
MQFVNLTPFEALAFTGVDTHDREYDIVVMKVGFALVKKSAEQLANDAKLFEGRLTTTHYCVVMDGDEKAPITMADEYHGELNISSVKRESDLAPYKPRCDVLLVNANAYAPEGAPSSKWPVRLRVTVTHSAHAAPQPQQAQAQAQALNPLMNPPTPQAQAALKETAQVVIDKQLTVHGPRSFERGITGWSLGASTACTSVPMRWEYSYGGASIVVQPPSADGVQAAQTLLNEVCFTNPVGCGWVDARFFKLTEKTGQPKVKRLPAPQIEQLNSPISQLDICDNQQAATDAPGFARAAQAYLYKPANFAGLGRAWTPRVQRAGTYDDTWQKTRWPNLPKDMDFGYWNCAPDDQQIAFPEPGVVIEWFNLSKPDDSFQGYVCVQLPPHRAFLLQRMPGLRVPVPMQIDAIEIQPEINQVHVTWRGATVKEAEIDTLEARYEIDPDSPLHKVAKKKSSKPTARVD